MKGLDPARRERISEVLKMSRQMLWFAENQEWDDLVDTEKKRRPLIEGIFTPPPTEEESLELAAMIREIQRIDAEVMAQGKTGLDQLASDLKQAGSGKRATQAYGANSG